MFQGMEYIYEVYREKSFSNAAKNLYISQPALSSAVRRIEKKIGAPVFDRSTSPIRLTECGERYIQAVEQIMGIEQNFSDFLADFNNLNAGTLTIGGNELFSSYILPSLLADFRRQYPNISVKLIEDNTVNLKKHLISGSVDMVIENLPFSDNLFDQYFYGCENLLLAVPKQFPVNASVLSCQVRLDNILSGSYLAEYYPPVPLESMKDQPFLFLQPDNDISRYGAGLCRKHGFEPSVIQTLDQQMTAYNLTCAGIGISFVSDTLAKNVPPHPNVIFYKLDPELSRRNIYFYTKHSRYMTKAMEAFLRHAAGPKPGHED